jgi:hypothetical protein
VIFVIFISTAYITKLFFLSFGANIYVTNPATSPQLMKISEGLLYSIIDNIIM